MTKYALTCKHCKWEYEKDQPPPANAKPRTKPEDLEPSGMLTSDFLDKAVCPKCNKTGAKSGWNGLKPNES